MITDELIDTPSLLWGGGPYRLARPSYLPLRSSRLLAIISKALGTGNDFKMVRDTMWTSESEKCWEDPRLV